MFSIEDGEHLEKLTMDDLHGILRAYEMRIHQENQSRIEASFKASKETKNHEEISNHILFDEIDQEESCFIRKLRKGIGKHKGKLPLKCFNYGNIGNFTFKCIHSKQNIMMMNKNHFINKIRKNSKREKMVPRKYLTRKRKLFYYKEDSSSFGESDDEEIEFLFMCIENKNDPAKNKNCEEE